MADIVCDTQASKIKLTLRPLPDLGWSVDGDKVSFDQRQSGSGRRIRTYNLTVNSGLLYR